MLLKRRQKEQRRAELKALTKKKHKPVCYHFWNRNLTSLPKKILQYDPCRMAQC
eukprot:TRINITY_DN37818_c0_g1_i1.p2 TRINITY_DN37818_c0_g1~~TRINITY_DN37818_c0_g1_i1.p2  ORF type:complete len:54 (+),score=0.73 TRINITY_DN37818_c0_g1_i1:57-218(+)